MKQNRNCKTKDSNKATDESRKIETKPRKGSGYKPRKETNMKNIIDKIKVALWKMGALKIVFTSEGWSYVRV